MELVDQDGSVVEIHVWDEAGDQVKNLVNGRGITVVGCSVQREADGHQVKLNLWESACVSRGGPTAQALTRWDPQNTSLTKLTATYTPSGPMLPVTSEGLPTCAAALVNAPKLQDASSR
jgi:hypothetical protein